jgi:hypothetical protein
MQGIKNVCSICREPVPTTLQYRKNFAINDAVQPFIEALVAHGHPHWQKGGLRADERTAKTE